MPLSAYLPKPVQDLYAQFPLVTLPRAFSPHRAEPPASAELWIAPRPASSSSEWSTHPRSLRIQLLVRLAGASDVRWKDWQSSASAPDGTLPALFVPGRGLIAADDIRAWIDEAHAFYPADDPHHGYPSASLALEARCFGRLVESSIYPAFLASSPLSSSTQTELAVLLPSPPPWWAGLAAPLPMIAAFGESRRRFDTDALTREGARAIKALAARLKAENGGKDGWFLGCPEPTPLDCLIVAHLSALWATLPHTSSLRRALEVEPALRAYMERLLAKLGAPTPAAKAEQ